MKDLGSENKLRDKVFSVTADKFEQLAVDIFAYQYQHNHLYREFCGLMRRTPQTVSALTEIPFLPISFFKTHDVVTSSSDGELVFESSGTTGMISSRHIVKDPGIYRQSFNECFKEFYSEPSDYSILALLPSYLERGNSSLVYMVQSLIADSGNETSGFYLASGKALRDMLFANESKGQKTLLVGVTYALLDFAEQYPMKLEHTIIMETGGMKGRKHEMLRAEVHEQLKKQLGVNVIHSEYGMTELLSQAYSDGNGIFRCPAWMRVVLRSEDDPLHLIGTPPTQKAGSTGVVNVIDLANLYSCSFIATDDVGRLYADGSFEILGRLDNSDIRGCSLLSI